MYKVIIGLEVHCELQTNAKVFSGARNDYSVIPNSNISAIDLGFPGIMPYPNEDAIYKALKTAIALNCNNPDEVVFDRKNYFYPDLPKGFQITQVTKPMGKNGYLMIDVEGETKKVLIHQLHLEEDTASLDHYPNYSLLDYNRSGVPLIEIVTEPCLNSSIESVTFLEELRNVFLYCEVSEAASDKGQMRCDVNISLMKEDDEEFGTKVEIKNINSFFNVKKAIEYEIERQTEILDNGQNVIMETRRYDDNDMKTYSMREKVEAVDYKYFIEPNIVPVKITKEYLETIAKTIPVLAFERMNNYIELGLSRYDAKVIVKSMKIAHYFEEMLELGCDPRKASNWVTTRVLGHLNKVNIDINDFYLTPYMLYDLIKMVDKKEISSKQAREVFYECLNVNKPPKELIAEMDIKQIVNEDAIKAVVMEVLNENEDNVTSYKNGKTNVLDYLVGQVMKKTKGQANPAIAYNMLKEEMEK